MGQSPLFTHRPDLPLLSSERVSCAVGTGHCALRTGPCAVGTGPCALGSGPCALRTGPCAAPGPRVGSKDRDLQTAQVPVGLANAVQSQERKLALPAPAWEPLPAHGSPPPAISWNNGPEATEVGRLGPPPLWEWVRQGAFQSENRRDTVACGGFRGARPPGPELQRLLMGQEDPEDEDRAGAGAWKMLYGDGRWLRGWKAAHFLRKTLRDPTLHRLSVPS